MREKEPVKEEPSKELSPRKESCLVNIVEERLQIKGILHINCFGKCFEELFSYFLREKKRREPSFIFACNGFFKLIIKSLGSYF